MVLNPGAMGDGLRHAFNQNQGRSRPEAQSAPQATGLNPEDEKAENEDKSFVQCNPNPNLYNTENGNIPVSDTAYVEGGSNRTTREAHDVKRVDDVKRANQIKLGDSISYAGGEGTVVARENLMIKIADHDSHIISTVPVSETFFKGDIIGSNVESQMWDLMQREARSAFLSKAQILGDTQKAYLNREWHDIPEDVRDVIKEVNYYDGVPHGGVEGREPSHNDRNEESRSFRDVTQPAHVTTPYEDKSAPAFAKDKSDVEHGAYGGVVTDTPFDAEDDYEEDTRTGDRKQTQHERVKEPKDPKKYPTDPKWNEQHKGEQQQAAITGKPDLKKEEEEKNKQIGSYPSAQDQSGSTTKQTHEPSTNPTTVAGTLKDEDRGVTSDAGGFQGAKNNSQSHEKAEQDLAAITGEGEKTKEDGASSTGGKTGPTFGQGPTRDKAAEKNYTNKHNTRWGMRQASDDEIKAFLDKA